MPLVTKKPKKFRPIQSPYDEFLVQNRQLKTTIDDNERRFLTSFETQLGLQIKRWWHRTRISLGLKPETSIDEFQIEPEEAPAKKSAWSESLSDIEERVKARELKKAARNSPTHIVQISSTRLPAMTQTNQHAVALEVSRELDATCEALYAEYRERIWRRSQSEGRNLTALDAQIDTILNLYQSQKASYEKTIKELQALENGK